MSSSTLVQSSKRSSKLDYLSKYTEEKEKSKRDKKKKKKRTSERQSDAVHIRDIDDDVVVAPKHSDDEDIDEDEESRPVVVDLNGESNGHGMTMQSTRGTWDEVSARSHALQRQRHDSSDSDNNTDNITRQDKRHSTRESAKSNRRRRHDSDEDSAPSATRGRGSDRARRKRHDSEESGNTNPKKLPVDRHDSSQRQRHDSSDSESGSHHAPSSPVRRLAESDKDLQQYQTTLSKNFRHKRRHDSDSSGSDRDARSSRDSNLEPAVARMASGHRAGMQTGKDFATTEVRLQQSKRDAAQKMVDSHGVGETVHRDRTSGRIRDEGATDDTAQAAATQALLNTGRIQLAQKEQQQRELAAIRETTFARHEDNGELEEWRKRQIRADDPMATQARKAAPSTRAGTGPPQRPVYKGPPAKPNRYGIPPGHRWDGRDRGNGFEDKLLTQRFSAQHKQEQAYRYSSADM